VAAPKLKLAARGIKCKEEEIIRVKKGSRHNRDLERCERMEREDLPNEFFRLFFQTEN
jgi:hypothetical protein